MFYTFRIKNDLNISNLNIYTLYIYILTYIHFNIKFLLYLRI